MGHLLGYARDLDHRPAPDLQIDALQRPAATGCSPRPPAAPAPTAPSSTSSWTSCGPATPWSSGNSIGSAAPCAIRWTPSPAWPTAASGSAALQESIDTTTPGGKLVFHVFAALAEFERDLIRERTTAGLAAARARGRNGGRPPVLDPGQVELARELYASRRYTTAEIARRLKVGRSTLYRYLDPEPTP